MLKDEDVVRLRHMHDAARRATKFAQGRSRADLDTDDMFALALARLLEILGEAAKNVSPECRQGYPQIPWKSVAGTRDRLIHGYFDMDLDIIWEIVTVDLPPLSAALETIISSLE